MEGALLFIVLSVFMYFLPFLIAILRKKRNSGAIGLLTLLLGWTVLGWIVALIWSCTSDAPVAISTAPTSAANSGDMRKCPFCAEEIRIEAIKCRFCGSELPAVPPPQQISTPAASRSSRKLIYAVVVAFVFSVGGLFIMFQMAEALSSAGPLVSAKASNAKASDVKAKGKWRVSEDVNQMDKTKEVFIVVESEDSVPLLIGSARPILGIRCVKNKTEVGIDLRTPIEHVGEEYGTATVRLRLDDEGPRQERWKDSTNLTGLFSLSPIPLAKRMAKAKTLHFEFTPFQRTEMTVRFLVEGLDAHLPKVAKACGW